MKVAKLDHLVFTVADIDATCKFYTRVLGMKAVTFGQGRRALAYGDQKINLHPVGGELEPKAAHPAPGTMDLCFITLTPMTEVLTHLKSCGVSIVEGPVDRTGATGPITSVYFRDPDENLIEVAHYRDSGDIGDCAQGL